MDTFTVLHLRKALAEACETIAYLAPESFDSPEHAQAFRARLERLQGLAKSNPPRERTILGRSERGAALALELEAVYHNGDAMDNLTDALTDLIHSGLPEATIERSARSASMHFEAEREDEDEDEARYASKSRATPEELEAEVEPDEPNNPEEPFRRRGAD